METLPFLARLACLILCFTLTTIPVAVGAQTLSFLSPQATAPTAGVDDALQYTVGDAVVVRWATAFRYTTLRVYQGPLADGTYVQEDLARNRTFASTTYTWHASALGSAALLQPFHFQLLNGQDPNCAGCVADSVTFHVARPAFPSLKTNSTTSSSGPASSGTAASNRTASIVTTSSRTANSTTTASLTGSSSTAPTTSTAARILETSATPAASTDSKHPKSDMNVALGVGLGVSIPILILLGLLIFWLVRRRQSGSESILSKRHPSTEAPSVIDTAMKERESREPLHAPYQMYLSGAMASSKSSYFEPFDFERPGNQDWDTRSIVSDVTTRGASAAARWSAREWRRTPTWPLSARSSR